MDTGSGIDKIDQEKVFEPFYQGRRRPESHVKGTGLGLSIAREYALSHGGNVDLMQPKIGAGAHFRLTLPMHDPESFS